ncbi:MAG: hypothetical protein LUD72_06375 [Bacteroidales bacterium]|nr:hypothetical protein [Bacteroidales bacterium]
MNNEPDLSVSCAIAEQKPQTEQKRPPELKPLINEDVLQGILKKGNGLINHAKMELDFAGYTENAEDPINQLMRKQILELIAVFSEHGHSGSSAPWAISLFERLASYKTLSPLKLTDEEFGEAASGSLQNIRKSSIFKDGENKFHDIDAFVMISEYRLPYQTKREDLEKGTGIGWHGTVYEMKNDVLTGRKFRTCYIKPSMIKEDGYTPVPPRKVECTEVEVAPEDWLFCAEEVDIWNSGLERFYNIEWVDCPEYRGKSIYELNNSEEPKTEAPVGENTEENENV